MTKQEKADEFWGDCSGGQPAITEGSEVLIEGRRFRWVRNEFGVLYRKSIEPQFGWKNAVRYTVQEFVAQMEASAKAVEALLPHGVRAALRPYLIMAQFEYTPPKARRLTSAARTAARSSRGAARFVTERS